MVATQRLHDQPRRQRPNYLAEPLTATVHGATFVLSFVLLGLVPGCAAECDDPRFPPGTVFRIEVMEELPHSSMCHRFHLRAGSSFTRVAGQTNVNMEGCELTGAAGPPIGVEAEFTINQCKSIGELSAQCVATYAACSDERATTQVKFILQADLRTLPAVGTFAVEEGPPCEGLSYCIDQFRVRVDRLAE